MPNLEQVFFELIQMMVGMRDSLSIMPTEEQWGTLYKMAKKQTIAGVLYPTVDRIVRGEGMDEDMRTAMEILISEYSCYTPFKPFLMDLVATNDLFMPNKLEFLSGVVLNDRKNDGSKI